MSLREHKTSQQALIGMIIFSWVIVLGILTLTKPFVSYEQSFEQTLNAVLTTKSEIKPEKVYTMVEGREGGFMIIDLRNPDAFEAGSIQGSINIPDYELFEKKNMKYLRELQSDSIQIILVGADQMQANMSWMLLYQTGLTSAKQMLGGYDYYLKLDTSPIAEMPEYMVEEPKYDFAAIRDEILHDSFESDAGRMDQPAVVVPRKKKKSSAAEGGC